MYKAPLAASYL